MESYITVLQHSSFEYEDRKSVFIGEALPVSTEEEALAFIESVKKRYPDARHHVYAYVLRAMKLGRIIANPADRDSIRDLCGYAGILCDMVGAQDKEKE